MKSQIKRLLSLILCLTLTLCITGMKKADAAQSSAKPFLSVKNSISIYTGKKKTVLIKNVKGKDVSSLNVKAGNPSSTKVVKKLINGKKVGFVLKALGPHASEIEVTLKLRKKIAGKKVFKFSFTAITGAPDAPEADLIDGLKKNDHHVSVFKEGEEPKEWENWIELGIGNMAQIDNRNIDIKWYENGKKGTGQNDSLFCYRPDTSKVKNKEKGFDEGTVSCKVLNCISKKEASDEQRYCVVSQDFIDSSTDKLKSFAEKYPYKSYDEVPSDETSLNAYSGDFFELLNSYGKILGLSWETINYFGKIYADAENDPVKDIGKLMSDAIDSYEDECMMNAENLGIPQEDVSLFCDLLNTFTLKGIAKEASYIPPARNDGKVKIKVTLQQDAWIYGRLRVLYEFWGDLYYTSTLEHGHKGSVTVTGDHKEDTIGLDYQIWVFGYWETAYNYSMWPNYPSTETRRWNMMGDISSSSEGDFTKLILRAGETGELFYYEEIYP